MPVISKKANLKPAMSSEEFENIIPLRIVNISINIKNSFLADL